MRNKLKIAAVILTVVVGMVLYKEHFERRQKSEEKEAKTKSKPSVSHWN